jgi:hypothetical protein
LTIVGHGRRPVRTFGHGFVTIMPDAGLTWGRRHRRASSALTIRSVGQVPGSASRHQLDLDVTAD